MNIYIYIYIYIYISIYQKVYIMEYISCSNKKRPTKGIINAMEKVSFLGALKKNCENYNLVIFALEISIIL